MTRITDRTFFALTGAAGVLILAGSMLPTWTVGLDAAVGAGDAQRAYNFNRELRAITYTAPGSLLFPIGGAALGAVGLLGLIRPSKWPALAAAAVATVLFVQAIRTIDYLQGPTRLGVHSCEAPQLEHCIGFLASAVRDLRADILRKPIAREPEFLDPGEHSYRSNGRSGWTLMGWTIAVFAFVAWFRAALILTGSVGVAFALVGVIGVVVLLYLFGKLLEAVGES